MDYQSFHFSKAQWIKTFGMSLCISGAIAYLFYDSAYGLILLPIVGIGVFVIEKKNANDTRKKELTVQFRDAILAVATALRSGYSPENAFREALRDLKLNYAPDADMVQELMAIQRKLGNNFLLEDVLFDFAERCQIEEVMDFTQVFRIAKRKGGDLGKIIQNTAGVISEKIEIQREIQTMLTARQFEQTIMNAIPMLIIFYIKMTSPGFFDPLYHNPIGTGLMTACLIVYAFAYFLGKKMTQIEV